MTQSMMAFAMAEPGKPVGLTVWTTERSLTRHIARKRADEKLHL